MYVPRLTYEEDQTGILNELIARMEKVAGELNPSGDGPWDLAGDLLQTEQQMLSIFKLDDSQPLDKVEAIIRALTLQTYMLCPRTFSCGTLETVQTRRLPDDDD